MIRDIDMLFVLTAFLLLGVMCIIALLESP